MNILSIQSAVAYGHVGNAAASFALQRLGHEVWRVDTVQFSNHTGYGDWRGPVLAPTDVADVIAGVEDRGLLPHCDGVLSGYMGDAALGEVIVDAVARVRAANAAAVYCCDPVLGDVGRGFYVPDGVPEFVRERAVPAADIVTPNQFELEFLTGGAVNDLDQALAAAAAVRDLGPRLVLVTSLRRTDAPPRTIEMLAAGAEAAWLVATPLLSLDPKPNGAGDVAAALFLARYLETGNIADALGRVADAVFALIEATQAAGTRELQLIAAQDRLVAPDRRFAPRRVA